MNDFPDSRITKKTLSEHFSISLTTTRRTLEAIGADLSFRTYSPETLERFAFARELFRKGWSKNRVETFFSLRSDAKNISNQQSHY